MLRGGLVRPDMAWSEIERLLPFGDDKDEDNIYRTDVQIGSLNALNALMAIMRWMRWTNYFADERDEVNAVYMIEGNNIANRAA